MPPVVLMLTFSTLMLIVGVRMIRHRPASMIKTPALGTFVLASIGFGVGVVTGLIGVGGGFVIVPALVFFARFDLMNAVGSSLTVITLNSLAGLFGQLGHISIDWSLMLAFLAASLVGMLAGSALVERVPHAFLKHAFGWSVLAVGLLLAVVNLRAFASIS